MEKHLVDRLVHRHLGRMQQQLRLVGRLQGWMISMIDKPAASTQRESLLEFENDLTAKNRTSNTQSTVIEPGGRRRRTPKRTNAIAVAGGTAAICRSIFRASEYFQRYFAV